MTELDGNAILEIKKLVNETHPYLTVPFEQKGVYFLRQPDGSFERQRADLDPQGAVMYDLNSLIAETKRQEEFVRPASVYVRDDGVVAVLDNAGDDPVDPESVRWSLSLALGLHPAFVFLQQLKMLRFFTQKDLVRSLRTELSKYVDLTVITLFANVKTSRNETGASSVTPMSSGLDRKIQRQVQADNGGEVPEQITFSVPVYDLPEARTDGYIIHAYVEYDHDAEKFGLIVVHDELREAQEAAVKKIIQTLSGELGRPVLYGKPV